MSVEKEVEDTKAPRLKGETGHPCGYPWPYTYPLEPAWFAGWQCTAFGWRQILPAKKMNKKAPCEGIIL